MLRVGLIDPKPNIRDVRETPSTATVDGGNGLGLVGGPKANAIAMEKALAGGSGWGSGRNTNHHGIAGCYVVPGRRRGPIGSGLDHPARDPGPLAGGWAV